MLVRIVIASSLGACDLGAFGLVPGLRCRAHHFQAPQGVDIQQLHPRQGQWRWKRPP